MLTRAEKQNFYKTKQPILTEFFKLKRNSNDNDSKSNSKNILVENVDCNVEEKIQQKRIRRKIISDDIDSDTEKCEDYRNLHIFAFDPSIDRIYKQPEGAEVQLPTNAWKKDILDSRKQVIQYVESHGARRSLNASVDKIEKTHSRLLNLPVAHTSNYFREYVEILTENALKQQGLASTAKSFPRWLLPEYIKDSQMRNPDDPCYDVSTIWIPPRGSSESKVDARHFTPAMEQYWEVKAQNFDKIVFFKIGKFYELFYIDAFIANRICSLRWMGLEGKPHVGFPEVSLHVHARTLVDNGFKIVVVEQMETPKELEERNRSGLTDKKSKAVRRSVHEIFTSGTLTHENMLSTESKFILSIVTERNESFLAFGYTFSDVSISKFWVGNYQSHSKENVSNTYRALKTLMFYLMPAEVVVEKGLCNIAALKILQQLLSMSQINCLTIDKTAEQAFKEFSSVLGTDFLNSTCTEISMKNQNILGKMKENTSELSRRAFVLLLHYLNKTLLAEKLLPFARLNHFCLNNFLYEKDLDVFPQKSKPHMFLSEATMRHLSILHNSEGFVTGSLLEYLNHTCTSAGFRLLREWISSPICSIDELEKRYDSVEFFIHNSDLRAVVRAQLKQLPDIERGLTSIRAQAQQGNRTAVYFNDIHSKQFSSFVRILQSLLSIEAIFKDILNHLSAFNAFNGTVDCTIEKTNTAGYDLVQGTQHSRHLLSLCLLQKVNNSHAHNEEIQALLYSLEKNSQSQLWSLKRGIDEEYDSIITAIHQKKIELDTYLKDLIEKVQKLHTSTEYGWNQIRYVHAKFPFEIEVPESHVFWKYMKDTDTMASELTSSRQGFVRFRTKTILNLIEELDEYNEQLKHALYGCQRRFFSKFYDAHYSYSLDLIRSMAEIDILSGFAHLASSGCLNKNSVNATQVMCRPKLIPHSLHRQPIFRIIDGRHPTVALTFKNSMDYVTNDIHLNDPESSYGIHSFYLLTGPNMGGKSTVLRQVCLTAIISQVGSFVPASECIMTPVDCIYTRLGAYDSILEGKSTFLTELEETSLAISGATQQSLVVLDELGRGTSTFDGTAVALAVAKCFATKIQCRCLFATHFQILSEELKVYPTIFPVHMAAEVRDNKLVLLYRLKHGVCSKSHGIEIARISNISESILKKAEDKAEKFHKASRRLYILSLVQKLLDKIHINILKNENEDSIWKALQTELLKIISTEVNLH